MAPCQALQNRLQAGLQEALNFKPTLGLQHNLALVVQQEIRRRLCDLVVVGNGRIPTLELAHI